MKNVKLLLLVFVFLISLYSVNSICSVNLDRTQYSQGETITAQMSCSEVAEKLDAYTLNWTNENGTQIELDTGTTPNTVGESFFQTFIIPSDYVTVNGSNITATLQGTDLEGFDSADIVTASSNDLILSGFAVSDAWLGLDTGISFLLKDENDKRISGGYCDVHIHDNTNTFMKKELENIIPATGHVGTTTILGYDAFEEGIDYLVAAHCFCGAESSGFECIDEDGNNVTHSTGRALFPFKTKTWITWNDEDNIPIVHENGSDYPNAVVFADFDEKTYWLINISNSKDEELEIRTDGFLINNETKELLVISNNRINRPFSIPAGNSTTIASSNIPKEAQSGIYFIRIFVNVLFNNILVAQYIQDTETFNITGTDDTFKLEEVITDKKDYYTGESVHLCANITNNFNRRVEFEIFYNIRCSTTGMDSDLERSIVSEHFERREVDSFTSQMQCAELPVNYLDHLLYQTSQCYGSVTIESVYINTFDNKKILISNTFNVIDFGLYPEYELNPKHPLIRLFPNWLRFDDVIDNVSRSYFRTQVNISDLDEQKLDPNDDITNSSWHILFSCTDNMPLSTNHFNYTVLDASGNIINKTINAIEEQHKDLDGTIVSLCAIEIEDVNLSDVDDEYFEIKIFYEDFEERSTLALENISDKTGTFHFDIDCPTYASGTDVECTITAFIESGEVEKEVDFDCFVDDGRSALNFNEMITSTPKVIKKTFGLVGFTNTQHTVTCKASYYNFGSRTDTFSDTFELRVGNPRERIEDFIEDNLFVIIGSILSIFIFSLAIIYFKQQNNNH